jgi:hypothetical protein
MTLMMAQISRARIIRPIMPPYSDICFPFLPEVQFDRKSTKVTDRVLAPRRNRAAPAGSRPHVSTDQSPRMNRRIRIRSKNSTSRQEFLTLLVGHAEGRVAADASRSPRPDRITLQLNMGDESSPA